MTALAMKQKGLKPSAKIVLYWLADHHNGETGQCNPSIKRLAECCEMSRRSVEKHIGELEELGLLEVSQCFRDGGGKAANSYVFRLADSDAQNLRMGSAKSAHGGCAKSAHERTLEYTNLGKEPHDGSDEPALFSGMEEPERQEDRVESGFDAFWKEIWPSHFRKAGKVDCLKLYRKACEGKHAKAEGALTPDQLNAAARRYIASVEDRQFLKAPKAWLNGALWEPWLGEPDPQHVRRNEDFMERVR
ncbi:MAG: helix-turn-helix domain-containing protein [Roseovarius sp.]|nr:helix-turn-helix domain-containing protein [Roseovarius sp.]